MYHDAAGSWVSVEGDGEGIAAFCEDFCSSSDDGELPGPTPASLDQRNAPPEVRQLRSRALVVESHSTPLKSVSPQHDHYWARRPELRTTSSTEHMKPAVMFPSQPAAVADKAPVVALLDPTGGSLNIAEIRPVAKETTSCEWLAGLLDSVPPHVTARQLAPPLDGCILENVLSPDECRALVARTSEVGYSFWDPEQKRRDFRSADTVELHSIQFAKAIWERIRPHVPLSVDVREGQLRWERETAGKWSAYGVNPDLLFGQYKEGGHFSPHTDGYSIVDFNRRSLYSMIVYLNDCKAGGSTQLLALSEGQAYAIDSQGRFRAPDNSIVDAAPAKAGSALLFYQTVVHEGEPVGAGCHKFIIRTDLMFQRDTPCCDSESDVTAFRLLKEAEELENAGDAEGAAKLFRRVFKMSPALCKVYGM